MWILKLLAVLILSAPLAVVATFMLGPLWAHVESTYGIEAVGHAMYAGWCYVATYAALVTLGLGVLGWLSVRRARGRSGVTALGGAGDP
jgi:hypothetical protein